MSNYARLSLALLATTLGCGSSVDGGETTTGGSTGGSTGGATTGGAGGGPSTPSYEVTFDPVTVSPGIERTQCVVKNLGNDALIRVGRIHNLLNAGSHHLIVYRTNDTVEQLAPFDCQPFTDALDPAKGSPLMITQKHEETLTLPQGVAFSLQPNTMVRLEMHYLNTSDADVTVQATSTFITIPDADFTDEADFLFIGNPDISIPAMSPATLGPTYFTPPATLGLAGVKFFGITGHTHQWGTNVTVAAAPSAAGPDTPVYDVPSWQWNEPATVYHDPPFTLPEGGGFNFTCSWNNFSSQTVSFGESANQEMCFFWAYYYPSQGAYVCFHTDKVVGGIDACCPGSQLCDYL
jgi:hypothetical protein